MLTAVIATIAVLMVVHKLLTAITYFFDIPIYLFRIESYLAYVIAVFCIGSLLMVEDTIIKIILVALAILWIIQAVLNYFDYEYEMQQAYEQEEPTDADKNGEKKKRKGEGKTFSFFLYKMHIFWNRRNNF